MLLRSVRLVPIGTGPPPADVAAGTVDVRIDGARVVEIGPDLTTAGVGEVVEADGRYLIPGLWDYHVHFAQWAHTVNRLDLSGTAGPGEVLHRVTQAVATMADRPGALSGFGYRSAGWTEPPTVAALDAVTGRRPVALIAGDGHNGWLNSAALELLGLSGVTGALDETEWFAVWPRLDELPGAADALDSGLRSAVAGAAAMGVVGIVDMEFTAALNTWPARFAAGLNTLKVRTAVYHEGLDQILDSGIRTGDRWPGTGGLAVMGPFKIITDGSLGTRTAHCHQAYPQGGGQPYGKQNIDPDQLAAVLARARTGGLTAAVHAIGDAAVDIALAAIEQAGIAATVEHAQLMTRAAVATMARLGVRASVQPAHLLDDRDLTTLIWPGREDRSFMLRSMLDAGVELAMGSDAPVARLDPWLAMAAAVHRSADEREPWVPQEAITPGEALAASTDGLGTVAVEHPADLVLLDADPLAPGRPAETAARLRTMPVAATWVAGRQVHSTL